MGRPGGGWREQGADRHSRKPGAAREAGRPPEPCGSLSPMLAPPTGRSQRTHPQPWPAGSGEESHLDPSSLSLEGGGTCKMELTWGSVPKEPGGGVSSLQPDSFKLLPLGLSGPAQSLPKVGQSGVWGWRGSWRGGEKG